MPTCRIVNERARTLRCSHLRKQPCEKNVLVLVHGLRKPGDNPPVALFRSAIWAAPSVVLALLGGAPARAERQHTVSEGQSLVSIAHGYRVSVSSLAAANQLSPDAFLRVGAVLSVPEQS